MIIQCDESCHNSPKKELLKELTVNFAKNKIEFLLDFVVDNIVGVHQIEGRENSAEYLSDIKFVNLKKLLFHNIIPHGNVGSVNGTFLCEQEIIHFCSIFNFAGHSKNAKIKTITSYVLKQETSPLCNGNIREIHFLMNGMRFPFNVRHNDFAFWNARNRIHVEC